MKVDAKYNWQANNPTEEKITGGSQCGYTAAGIAMSIVDARYASDEYIAELVHAMENTEGWIRKEILKSFPKARGRLGAIGDYLAIAMKLQLKRDGHTKFKVEFTPHSGTWMETHNINKRGGTVLLSTMLVSSGHYISKIGFNDKDLDEGIFHDPAGDVRKKYFNEFGNAVLYRYSEFGEKFLASSAYTPKPNTLRYSAVLPV
jgi:hypothetical protein